MSLQSLISDLSYEAQSRAISPKHRRDVKRQLRRAERRMGKLELFAQSLEEILDKDDDWREEFIANELAAGVRPGCGCCGGDFLADVMASMSFGSWEEFQAKRETLHKRQQMDDAWGYWETRTQQISATAEALNISFQDAEAFWEEVNK